MKTIFLHLGMPKTGTSAIQLFCDVNSQKLREDGIVYRRMPWTYPGNNSRRNGMFLVKSLRNDQGEKDHQLRKAREKEAFAIMREWFQEADNILITEETLWNYLKIYSTRPIRIMRKFAKKQDAQLKLIIYLRRQDDWLVSMYRQHVTAGSQVESFTRYQQDLSRVAVNYDVQLRTLAELVGKENLIVRRYDFKDFKDGHIEYDFLEAMGVREHHNYRIPEGVANPSNPMNMIEIKRILNSIQDVSGASMHSDDSLVWERNLRDLKVRAPLSRRETLITPDQRQVFMAQFSEGNAAVARDYFGEKELFPEWDQNDVTVWESQDAFRYQDTVIFFGNALLMREHEIQILREQVNLQKQQMRQMQKDIGRLMRRTDFFKIQMENRKKAINDLRRPCYHLRKFLRRLRRKLGI